MPITYATADELAAYVAPDTIPHPAVPLATVLIRHASRLVLSATTGAIYSTTDAGVATDPKVYGALHEATLEQASAWAAHSVDPRKGAAGAPRQLSSKALNGAQAAYVSDPQRDLALSKLWAADELTDEARTILVNAGLITNRIASVPVGGYVPAVVGPESIHGGYPDTYYGPEPIPGVNI